MEAFQNSTDVCEEEETLVEERKVEDMVVSNSNQIITRKAWFLKSISASSSTPFAHGYNHESVTTVAENPPKVVFRGWANPQRQWSQWVDKLKPIYFDLWEKVGIFNAIQVSTYTFKRNSSSIWGAASFFNGDTNTFFFPWGEATVTLEDIMVLGGFSVTGEPVRLAIPLKGELREMESQMISEIKRFNRRSTRKAEMSAWVKYHMEVGRADEFEHVAFLALWLSRYVFSSHPAQTVKTNVIQIAIRLARGARIALAPAVLASIYRDLRVMKVHLAGSRDSPLLVWAPLNILQLWMWERFFDLRPPVTETLARNDEPRAVRWSNVGRITDFSFVISVLRSAEDFQRRPYEELGAFPYCLRACELVGLDCLEQYLPHRVAMQFGFDQDIPRFVPRADSTWEKAWETYDISRKNVKFYDPSRRSEPDVTFRYSVWWNKNVQRLPQKVEEKKRKTLLCSIAA